MATSTGYDYGIRQGLNEKGVSNDRISYDPSKGVMVDGQNFYKPEKVYQGTSFTNQNNFNQAWDNYSKAMANPSTGASTSGTSGTAAYNYDPYANNAMVKNNPYSSQADQIINQLLTYNQNQPAFDPYSSSAYKAAQAQADRASGQSTRAAQEAYGGAGFGRSTALGERVTGINNDANEYLMTQVLPQIEAQEAARRQQEFGNIMAALQPLLGQQSRADNLVQQDFDNRITNAGLTGNLLTGEAESLLNSLFDLKSQTEANWSGLNNEQRVAARSQGDQLRSRLQGMGVDPSLFGADVTANAARGNLSQAGVRTLPGQQLDYNQAADQRDYDRGVLENDRNFDRGVLENDRAFNEGVRQYNQDFEYTQGRDKVKDEQWQKEFDRIKEQDGIQNALAWAQHNLSVSRESRIASGGSGGSSSENEYTGGVISNPDMPRTAATMETWLINNIPGGKKVQGPPAPDQIAWYEMQILNNPNLSEKDMIKLYNRFGIPLPE